LVTPTPTTATGIAIGMPARGSQILAAVRATDGTVVAVMEDEIEAAYAALARRGFFVEETSATAIAALRSLQDRLPTDGPVVVPLTGHGLKARPRE
jgi:threonine synthase